MKKIIEIKQNSNSLMHLTWLINNICPNRCSYCPSDLHDGANHHYDWDNARKFFEILFQRYSKIHCSVSGGEASVSPFFREIVELFYNAGHTIGTTSNAAKPVRYWADISPFLDYICFSYHPEFSDDKFIEKALAAAKNTHVIIRVMMHPNHWDHCVEVFESISVMKKFSNVEPVRIFNWGGGSTKLANAYTQQQLDWLSSHPGVPFIDYELNSRRGNKPTADINASIYFNDGTIDQTPNTVDYINAGMTNFYGYTCEVGLKSLFVDWKGSIYLGNCLINGPIGNINDPDNINWPTSSVICNKNLCHCTSDVNINKHIL